MGRLPISCCYIVKNEAEYLRQSLESVAPFVQEIVVCDSGSTDPSPSIVKDFEKQVPHLIYFERPWNDNFADARNSTAARAQQPWILFVDGDESIEEADWSKIQEVTQRPGASCYSLVQRNYVTSASIETSQPLAGPKPKPLANFQHELFYFENHMERLYHRELGLLYTGRVHESLIPTAQRLGLVCEKTDIILHHYGRLKRPSQKYLYYLELSRAKLADDPKNPAAWVEVCINLMELLQMKEAYEIAKIAVRDFPNEPEIFRVAYQAALRCDAFKEAEDLIRKYLSFYPNDLFSKSQLTTAMLYQGKFSEVLNLSREILSSDPRNFVVHVNCAVIFFEKQDWKNAAHHISQGLKERPTDQFLNDAMNKIPSEFQIR